MTSQDAGNLMPWSPLSLSPWPQMAMEGQPNRARQQRESGQGQSFSTSMEGDIAKAAIAWSSTPGKQTVPRAEAWAGPLAASKLDLAPGQVAEWLCDASYVTKGVSKEHWIEEDDEGQLSR